MAGSVRAGAAADRASRARRHLGPAGRHPFAHAERLLGRPLEIRDVQELVRRYLAAFGPASARDMQA
ncbi:DNA glycosylase AlkZ-like family protein [Actinoplanes sp. CA-051413]|uniref:DNA glycosylase AlkZ-like family protein n=1 Tax=Actinoplanes sp. CA-051413 TaxID=3239899 RepID=UPI003D9714A7